MKRWDMYGTYNHIAGEEQAVAEESESGAWVRYDDAQHEIERLREYKEYHEFAEACIEKEVGPFKTLGDLAEAFRTMQAEIDRLRANLLRMRRRAGCALYDNVRCDTVGQLLSALKDIEQGCPDYPNGSDQAR